MLNRYKNISIIELLILKIIIDSPKTGRAFSDKLKAVLGKKPSSGTIYPILKKLILMKHIKVLQKIKNIKTYGITQKGIKRFDKLLNQHLLNSIILSKELSI